MEAQYPVGVMEKSWKEPEGVREGEGQYQWKVHLEGGSTQVNPSWGRWLVMELPTSASLSNSLRLFPRIIVCR